MLYCVKCRSVSEDGAGKCQNCKNTKLRAVDGKDMVLLHRADEYAAGLLARRFDEAGITYEVEPFQKGHVSYLYDSEVMPTDKNIFVAFEDLPAAKEISAAMKEQLDEQRLGASAGTGREEDAPEDMPTKKRVLVQAVSVLLFLLLIIATVLGADALSEWLKGLFGM